MKMRNGFVSNSSSSSFVIWTKELSEEVKEKLSQLVDDYNNDTHYDGECLEWEDHFIHGNLDHYGEARDRLINYTMENIPKEYWK